ncbi:hypothetical protein [Candidatus Uabimicrobium amorphum]|uniref:Uncharacterized protein n=1 Tax=Uabimicrobium amorphum TaxID=2596890 RepID=A0A5S9IP14_UABAM|nr:hypothetical protein [Candidatus Uabimicrobium amorphum]BBM84560.1 hypothetical protein UABAM_02921 [Candidatus Uabimicrobium amorphum]
MTVLLQSQVQKLRAANINTFLLIASFVTFFTPILLYFQKEVPRQHKSTVLLIGFSIAVVVIAVTIVYWKKSQIGAKVVRQDADIILEIEGISPITIHQYKYGQINVGKIRELIVGIYDQQGALVLRFKVMYGKMHSVPSHWTPNDIPAGKPTHEYSAKGKFLIELIDTLQNHPSA